MRRDRWRAPLPLMMVLLLAACSNVVRLPDCIDCRPVDMGIGEVLEVELGSDRAVTNDPEAYEWVIVDTGTMTLMETEELTRSEDPSEFIGGYSKSVIWTFEPTVPGTTQMAFAFVSVGDTDGPSSQDIEITVNVSG